MLRQHTRGRRKAASQGPNLRRLSLEALEERGSPSTLWCDGSWGTPPETSWTQFHQNRTDGGLQELLAASSVNRPAAVETDAWSQDHPLVPFRDQPPAAFEMPPGDYLGETQRGAPGSAMGVSRPLRIVEFYAEEGADGWWTFTGRVEADDLRDVDVHFGGLPTLEGQSVEVGSNGSFRLEIRLPRTPICEEGLATAQAIDWLGNKSTIAEYYVDQTNCPS